MITKRDITGDKNAEGRVLNRSLWKFYHSSGTAGKHKIFIGMAPGVGKPAGC